MFSSDKLDKLHVVLINSGKKLEILLRQFKTFEKVERENLSSFKMGLVSEKEHKNNMKRIKNERNQVEKKIKNLLESLIKDILKST